MEQGEFDFAYSGKEERDPLEAHWRADEDRASTIWSIPFRRTVRLRLEGLREEIEGVIRLHRRPLAWDRRQSLELHVNKMIFTNYQIEACTVIE